MDRCHKNGKKCNHHCNAYSSEELPYGFKKKGHCIELANQRSLIVGMSSLALEIKGVKDSLISLEITLRGINSVEIY